MNFRAALTGWGHCLPATVLTNKDLANRIHTTDEWIHARTGIRERRIAGPGETTSALCTAAGQRALERAGLDAADIDLVICATTTPDQLLPATGCIVRERLGAINAGAFDLNSACTGFTTAFITAAQFIQAGGCRRVLVVAGDTLSRFVDWQDCGTCILFGDGAGAAVLEADEQEGGVLSIALGCQGDLDNLLAIELPGPEASYIRMQGNEIFRLAIRAMSQAANQALARASISAEKIDRVIAHQANLRILRKTQQAIQVPDARMFVNVDRYGNTGAASVAIALSELAESDPPSPGNHVLLVAFGGGLTWAAAVFRWADVTAVAARRRVEISIAARNSASKGLCPQLT